MPSFLRHSFFPASCAKATLPDKQPSNLAAEIPEELFEHILWYARHRDEIRPLERHEKIDLSVYASVCKYWARLARRDLFRNITLRSLDDVRRFYEILVTPTLSDLEPVSTLVLVVRSSPVSGDAPWLHLLFMLVVPELREPPFLSVEGLSSHGKPWRTLHPSLPRSLPGSLMPLEELRLEGVHFPTGRMLSRLLSSVPLLRRLHALKLTFDTELRAEDFATPPYGRKMYVAATDRLLLCLAILPSLVANTNIGRLETKGPGGRSPRGIIDEDDMKTLWELLSVFDTAANFNMLYTFKQNTQGATNIIYIL